MARVELLFTAKNQASGAIRQVQNDMGGLKSSVADMKSQLGSLSGVGDILGSLSGGLGGVVGGIAGGLGVGAIVEAGQAIYDLGRSGAVLKELEGSFEEMAAAAGSSSEEMLSAMREASAGTIADSDLIQAANRAMTLGVADSADEMAGLLNVARVQAKKMGTDAASAFDDLVTGIGRASPQILDNLGIVIDGEAVYTAYAASIGKTAKELTDLEKKQAITSSLIGQAPEAPPLTDLDTFLQAEATVKNFWDEVSKRNTVQVALNIKELQRFGGAFGDFGQFMNDLGSQVGQGLGLASPGIEQLTTQLQRLQAEYAAAETGQTSALLKGDKDAAASYAVTLGDLSNQINNTKRTMFDMNSATTNSIYSQQLLAGASGQVASSTQTMAAAQAGAQGAMDALTSKMVSQTAIAYDLSAAVAQLNANTGPTKARSDILGELTPQINGITQGLIGNLGQDAALQMGDQLKVQTRDRIDQLREEGKTTEEIRLILGAEIADTQKWAASLDQVSEAAQEVKRKYEDIQNKAQGVLQGALNVDTGGAGIEALAPRDDVNENAKRLAAIMNEGFTNQPWLEEFKKEVPQVFAELQNSSDIKGTAARIMQQFQDGLRPELLDKDTAKQRVKDMILGEANLAELAKEIADEIAAEMNISGGDALAATKQALGISGGAVGDASTGQSFTDGAVAGVDGAKLVAKLTADLKNPDQLALVYAAGVAGGSSYGQGFMTTFGNNVPPQVIGALVALVTPGVLANIAAQQSQTGANP